MEFKDAKNETSKNVPGVVFLNSSNLYFIFNWFVYNLNIKALLLIQM